MPATKPTTISTEYSNIINTGMNLLPVFDTIGNTDANTEGFSYSYRSDTVKANTNVQNPGSQKLIQLGKSLAVGAASMIGNPISENITSNLIGSAFPNPNQQYTLASFEKIRTYASTIPYSKYRDFRSIQGTGVSRIRLDGASAAARAIANRDWQEAARAGAYAAASATPGGAYQLFNLETLYGWGNHGAGSEMSRLDFTTRSHISTTWKDKEGWKITRNPIELATEFRGDKINAVDYSKPGEGRSLKEAYRWKPAALPKLEGLTDVLNDLDQTSDFIKFYFTGPKLSPGNDKDTDDIITFRAAISSITDTFNPSWSPISFLGRADANYSYTSFARDLNISFDIYATSRDEMKPIWRKLNALGSYTTPDYSEDNIALKGPWMRFTLGDLFVQQPAFITSLSYTLHDSDTTWEINIEQDPTMMQAPKKISVTMALTIVTNTLPQKNGMMYSLAKQYESDSRPKRGNDNWLSDFSKNESELNEKLALRAQQGTGETSPGSSELNEESANRLQRGTGETSPGSS